jgi:hypothetical protein
MSRCLGMLGLSIWESAFGFVDFQGFILFFGNTIDLVFYISFKVGFLRSIYRCECGRFIFMPVGILRLASGSTHGRGVPGYCSLFFRIQRMVEWGSSS